MATYFSFSDYLVSNHTMRVWVIVGDHHFIVDCNEDEMEFACVTIEQSMVDVFGLDFVLAFQREYGYG